MKLTEHSELHVVMEEGGISTMTLSELALAFRGGLEMSGLTIFSEPEDAQAHSERIMWIAKGVKALQSLSVEDLSTLVVELEEKAMNKVLDKIC